DHDHDRGLAHDLATLSKQLPRRLFLKWIAGASLLPLIGCGTSDTGSPGTDGSTTPLDTASGKDAASGADAASGIDAAPPGSCDTIPEETGGPYPGDGSNGPNVLNQSGIVRSDIRSSFGTMNGTAAGIPLT